MLIEGELLAVELDSVFVLTQTGDVRSEPLSDVDRAVLAWYGPGKTGLAIWATLRVSLRIFHGS